jgi:hypothetical protein
VDVQHRKLVLQGSGNFTGGYITTNSTGTTYFSKRQFQPQRHGHGHQRD